MDHPRTTIGLIQIGDIVWEQRPARQFHLVDGALRPRPSSAEPTRASLAYLPHSAGLLQAYVSKYAPDSASLDFLVPLYKRIPLAEAVHHLHDADVVGFGTYIWNIRYSLAVARELKRQRPDTLIVMGGPQIPDAAEPFLRSNPFVDVVCHGEGERTFLEVLNRRESRDWTDVASTSFVDEHGRFIANARRARVPHLDDIPSPMLDGAYDALMRSVPDQKWLATWETNRGCPFTCTFCDWGSATASKVTRYSDERLYREIDWLADHRIQHIFVCDANFGMLPRDVEIARRLTSAYTRRNLPVAISVQNTKNRTDRSEQIHRIFKQSDVVSFGATISLQSVDQSVLKAIKRDNISLEAFESLQRHYASEGLDTYTDLIIGLPGESYESFTRGVESVIRNGQLNRVAFYECFVLPNAPMADPDYRMTFEIETVSTRIAQPHEPLERHEQYVPEFINMVVSTSTMPREDWISARVFAYFVELLFYGRILHIPITILGLRYALSFRRIFESFIDADAAEFPVLAQTAQHFKDHARGMAGGHERYRPSPEWLNIWWPVDQYELIDLARSRKLDSLYDEACAILMRHARSTGIDVDADLINDALRLNRAMLRLPFQLEDEVVETWHPVAQEYQALLRGQPPVTRSAPSACRVERAETIWMSWDDWCVDLVCWAFLPKDYLYPIQSLSGDPGVPIALTVGAATNLATEPAS